jgi:hypothetical protein
VRRQKCPQHNRVLPCSICTDHFQQKLKAAPVEAHLSGRQELFEWTVAMHNSVNRDTKKTDEMTNEEAFEYWKGICLGEKELVIKTPKRSRHQIPWKLVFSICCLVLLLAIVYLAMHKSGPKRMTLKSAVK